MLGTYGICENLLPPNSAQELYKPSPTKTSREGKKPRKTSLAGADIIAKVTQMVTASASTRAAIKISKTLIRRSSPFGL